MKRRKFDYAFLGMPVLLAVSRSDSGKCSSEASKDGARGRPPNSMAVYQSHRGYLSPNEPTQTIKMDIKWW